MPAPVIHTAYAFSNKNGVKTYRARAYIRSDLGKHTFIVALGDTPDEAIEDCLRYVRSYHVRDGVEPPSEIKHVGKIAGALLDAYLF